ncbi:hypothetical protein M8J77_004980 [Diaphorina citri]|nr:hypothetical protein M8J77_004980 [Diaphorina citri]
MTKRIRGTDEERKLLNELIIKYQDKVESKKTDTVSNLEKKEAWLKIAREYNAQGDHEEEMVDIIEIGLEDLEVNNEVLFDEDTLIADDLPMEEKTVQLGDGNILTTEKEYVSRAVQVKVQYRSKNIQVAPEKKDISTSPIKNKGKIRLPVIHSSSESSLLSSIPTVVPPLDSSYQINTSSESSDIEDEAQSTVLQQKQVQLQIMNENPKIYLGIDPHNIFVLDRLATRLNCKRANYYKVQSIIDCFEIEIQKPTNPSFQALSWSKYKKANTLKYLISCTPDGSINYISKGYGGRTSDVEIVKDCGYLEKLKPGMVIMADRGFKALESILGKLAIKDGTEIDEIKQIYDEIQGIQVMYPELVTLDDRRRSKTV